MILVGRRRNMLGYLKSVDIERYRSLIEPGSAPIKQERLDAFVVINRPEAVCADGLSALPTLHHGGG